MYLGQTVRCFETYHVIRCQRNSQHKLLPSANFKSQAIHVQEKTRPESLWNLFILILSGNNFKTVKTWYNVIPLSEKANHSFIFSGNRK